MKGMERKKRVNDARHLQLFISIDQSKTKLTNEEIKFFLILSIDQLKTKLTNDEKNSS